MSKFIIQDWAGNVMFNCRQFDSFEDGWEYIYEHIPVESDDDRTYDDIFVVPIDTE